MWKFVDDAECTRLTKNHSDRQIRHYVVYRKNSYFKQSERGNTLLERIISLYLTWKQKELNNFQTFHLSFHKPLPSMDTAQKHSLHFSKTSCNPILPLNSSSSFQTCYYFWIHVFKFNTLH
jgi:hypothetical protein